MLSSKTIKKLNLEGSLNDHVYENLANIFNETILKKFDISNNNDLSV